MKKSIVYALSLLAAMLMSGCSDRQADARRSEAQIYELLARWEQAFKARDLDGVMTMYAPR